MMSNLCAGNGIDSPAHVSYLLTNRLAGRRRSLAEQVWTTS